MRERLGCTALADSDDVVQSLGVRGWRRQEICTGCYSVGEISGPSSLWKISTSQTPAGDVVLLR